MLQEELYSNFLHSTNHISVKQLNFELVELYPLEDKIAGWSRRLHERTALSLESEPAARSVKLTSRLPSLKEAA